MTPDVDAEILAWVLLAKAGDVQGHEFHGNQYSEGQGGAAAGTPPPRQADPNRNQVSADRYGSTPPADSAQAPKTTQDIKPVVGDKHEPAPLPNHDTRIKSDPKDESPKGIRAWAKEVHYALLRGEQPIISGKHFGTLLAEFSRANTKGNDISKIRIDGTRLMSLDGKGYSRNQMPQIDSEARPQFLKDIEKSDGITVKPMNVDPTTLKPIQKEINGDKSGGIMSKNPSGIPDSMRILISSDGYVVDGHHTWAAAVALKLMGKSDTLPVYQLSCDWRKAMDVGLAWDKEHDVKLQGFDTKPPVGKSRWRR